MEKHDCKRRKLQMLKNFQIEMAKDLHTMESVKKPIVKRQFVKSAFAFCDFLSCHI